MQCHVSKKGCESYPEILRLLSVQGEKLLHKPGKGAFYNTELQQYLQARSITHLLFAGVTTEVCVWLAGPNVVQAH